MSEVRTGARFSLRSLFIFVAVCALLAVIARWLLQRPGCNLDIRATEHGLLLKGTVTGRSAFLSDVAITDLQTAEKLWVVKFGRSPSKAFELTYGEAPTVGEVHYPPDGQEPVSLNGRTIVVSARGSYESLFPPAISAWRTIAEVEVKAGKVLITNVKTHY